MWRSGVGDLSNKKGGMSRSDRRLKPLCAKKAVLNFVGNPPPHVLPGGLGRGRKIFSYPPWHNTKVVIDLRFPLNDQNFAQRTPIWETSVAPDRFVRAGWSAANREGHVPNRQAGRM